MSLLKRAFAYLLRKILSALGEVKVFKWPMFLVYDPEGYRLDGAQFKSVESEARRYDVLLCRYDKYLDTYLIPGWWNHAGVCLGEGRVEHAVSDGVVETTLYDFCKVDHVAVLRPAFHFDPVEVDRRLEKYLGCEYDFSFDASDNSTIYCSELVLHVFDGYDHGIVSTPFAGRDRVLPDDLLKANFKVVLQAVNDKKRKEA